MIKVLVADDQLGIRFFLEEYFCTENEVVTAINGKNALDAVEEEFFDLLITDIKMPKLSGIELIPAVRKLRPEMKIIAMTAYDADNTVAMLKKLQVDGILMKPFGIEDIRLIVDQVMGTD